ncbi:MAG: NAD+ synthase [Deltaproteobacteria bacterium]|nr:NAD+ synthase [Deltaproteobacteria bacterium]
MKIAICQIDPLIGDFEYNTALILDAAHQAKTAKCDLAVFPEMCLVGYPPKDLLEKPAFVRENLLQLKQLASRIEGIPVLLGYVDRNPGPTGKSLINSAALLKNGKIAGSGGKRLLPTYDVFDETRYFEPARGSLIFELGGLKWGVTICEDIWNIDDVSGIPRYPLDPVAELVSEQIDILLNISASPYSLKKEQLRLKILKKLCTTHGIPAIYCNQVGGNDDLLFDGSSMVLDAHGRLVALGKPFEPDIITWDTNHRSPEIQRPWLSDESAVLQGLIMGTRDYTMKCGFKKVLVGLSGGIDSSLVAYIAVQALGADNVLGVSMPSPYTSRMSKEDARLLCENLGIRLEEIPIGNLFDCYKDALGEIFSGLPEDETEENIQARIRGNLLMALSNKLNALLLTTGNKSEMAMGYCTLYGDMSGGLAVISDLPKTLCYRVAKYINRDAEIIPARIIIRPPSAELRPNQTDQDTLPPYEILDDILEAAVEKNLGPEEIVAKGHDPAVVNDVMRRLVMNEYKRRQAPPGLKITSKAFGYGRRYPIARGRRAF